MPVFSRQLTDLLVGTALILCLSLIAGRCLLLLSYPAALEAHSRGDYFKALPIVFGNALFADPGACGLLGTMYLLGRGVTKDGYRAEFWLRKSAAGGSVTSQALLGAMYASGKDVPRHVGRAQVWLAKAAAEGDKQAEVALTRLKRGIKT
jgi:TPR repeat protein